MARALSDRPITFVRFIFAIIFADASNVVTIFDEVTLALNVYIILVLVYH